MGDINTRRIIEIYIHIPFCVKKCNYCDFNSLVGNEDYYAYYVSALCNEIIFKSRRYNNCVVSSIYIGGGTPSIIKGALISKIIDSINSSFRIDDEVEITIECNPGTVSKELLSLYKTIGINRLSFGVQSTNEKELKLLGRIHDYTSFVTSLDYSLRLGFDNINVDIMYGIPNQNLKTLKKTLSDIVRFKIKHLSVYSLIIEENTPFYDKYIDDYLRQSKGEVTSFLPSEDMLCEMTDYIGAYLKSRGYHMYEISNYALEGYECKHNIGYWTRREYIGFGLGAASLYDNVRLKNPADMDRYINNWTKKNPVCEYDEKINLTKDEQMAEHMILGLRMSEGVSSEEFYNIYGRSLEAVYKDKINDLQDKGLVVVKGGRVKPTLTGMKLQNIIAREFI